ncbi:hypothetical protein Mnod_4076 [Methylobacterium nodulans ORS 2060]|uniref:Uncharacterized protein n=1 Tax=Methylobacterium nodulans (strain LMG 21967 / CNCM I-2342 / ORS 2060) TaxID=460265 RepID=B8ITN9_METNO|nr:hypothetical protein Mnod_4076 [Methylobacterium nodulans ORS 2060]
MLALRTLLTRSAGLAGRSLLAGGALFAPLPRRPLLARLTALARRPLLAGLSTLAGRSLFAALTGRTLLTRSAGLALQAALTLWPTLARRTLFTLLAALSRRSLFTLRTGLTAFARRALVTTLSALAGRTLLAALPTLSRWSLLSRWPLFSRGAVLASRPPLTGQALLAAFPGLALLATLAGRTILAVAAVPAILAVPADHAAKLLGLAVRQRDHEIAGAIDQSIGEADAVLAVHAVATVPAGRPVLRDRELADGCRDRLLDGGPQSLRVDVLAVPTVAPWRAILRRRNGCDRAGDLLGNSGTQQVRIEVLTVAAVLAVPPWLSCLATLARGAVAAIAAGRTILAVAADHKAEVPRLAVRQGEDERAAPIDPGARNTDAVLRNGDVADGLRDSLLDSSRERLRIEVLAVAAVFAVSARFSLLAALSGAPRLTMLALFATLTRSAIAAVGTVLAVPADHQAKITGLAIRQRDDELASPVDEGVSNTDAIRAVPARRSVLRNGDLPDRLRDGSLDSGREHLGIEVFSVPPISPGRPVLRLRDGCDRLGDLLGNRGTQ